MASRAQELVSRAVERARILRPGLAPDSVEVVELTRGQAFVVVRSGPGGILVLDRFGRLVRGRERLGAIGRHVRLLALLDGVLDEARLPQRREHAERSGAYLAQAAGGSRSRRAGPAVAEVIGALEALVAAIDDVVAQAGRRRELPPTERTWRRTVMLLNEAAAADREVVRAARRLAAELAAAWSAAAGPAEEKLRRWVVARLAAVDLPFFHPELEEAEVAAFAAGFVAAARAEAVVAPQ